MKLLLVFALLFLFLRQSIWAGATSDTLVPPVSASVLSPGDSPTSPISTSMAAFSPGKLAMLSLSLSLVVFVMAVHV